MTDYGQDLQFGIFPSPDAAAADLVLELSEAADVAGLDLVTIQDHPYQAKHLDTWTLLSFIAARTTSIRVAPNVANLPLRPPVVLARSVATLDRLSGGRVELGLGTGAFFDAIVAAGGERLTPGESIESLTEAMAVIRAVWGGEGAPTVRVEGRHHRVVGLHPGPAPAHPVEIWLGALKPRMLRLTGRSADGWLPSMGYVAPDTLRGHNRTIDEAAVKAGRDPAAIRRLYNIHGRFGSGSGTRPGAMLQGTPRDWAEQLAELTLTEGMSTYILAVNSLEQVDRFAHEVAPAVRELVDAERARRAAGPSPEAAAVSPADVEPEPADATEVGGPHTSSGSSISEGVAAQRHSGAGAHLVEVHDGLRAELARLRDIVEQVVAGEEQAHRARNAINELTMRQNNWTLGAYCAQYCRFVTGHHGLEDRSVFPHLRRSEPALTPVLDRLEQEHLVIHDVLEQLDEALVGLVSGASGTDELQRVVDRLSETLLAHLSFEEDELVAPLDRHGFA
ncbi:Hemerythrin HHE cation binding domain-containing protein [Pedococcus dokdonensis]|uniref:Hemerythrin HHE cation binding domain-containing protein n=1 Tax=Pedococcus dokdonensis TaxID=443156 RepID=A0A1H0TTB3_9MICO|nr:LLM class flavin-dependent oxidoreductase [Pedococcus dokdonensis]SDP57101.1 Hemerythrin HHE cation binding domain-containing protein [Pedococcus dokdonensis]